MTRTEGGGRGEKNLNQTLYYVCYVMIGDEITVSDFYACYAEEKEENPARARVKERGFLGNW